MTESKVCACGCGEVLYRGSMNIRQWSHRKYYSSKCKSKVGTINRRLRFENSGFVMAEYKQPSKEAAEAVHFFLYQQKPWTTEADLTG